MAREEVYRLQARVEVLEQVRLGREWLLLVSTDPSLRAVVPNHGMVGSFMRKGCRALAFSLCQVALYGIPQAGRP